MLRMWILQRESDVSAVTSIPSRFLQHSWMEVLKEPFNTAATLQSFTELISCSLSSGQLRKAGT